MHISMFSFLSHQSEDTPFCDPMLNKLSLVRSVTGLNSSEAIFSLKTVATKTQMIVLRVRCARCTGFAQRFTRWPQHNTGISGTVHAARPTPQPLLVRPFFPVPNFILKNHHPVSFSWYSQITLASGLGYYIFGATSTISSFPHAVIISYNEIQSGEIEGEKEG